jgi:hypothetical protein
MKHPAAQWLVTILAVLTLGVAFWSACCHYGIVGLRFSTQSVAITSAYEWPFDPKERVSGERVYPWPGMTWYACGPGGSRVLQVYHQGEATRVVCQEIIRYPWCRRPWR